MLLLFSDVETGITTLRLFVQAAGSSSKRYFIILGIAAPYTSLFCTPTSLVDFE